VVSRLLGVLALVVAIGGCGEPRDAELAPPELAPPLEWGSEQRLEAGDAAERDQLGYAASLGVDRAVLGAYGDDGNRGAAYVFVRNGDSFTEEQKLVASVGAENDQLGFAVSLGTDQALIGAPGSNASRGRALVFADDGTSFCEEQELVASDGGEGAYFGWSVSLHEGRALVGAYGSDTARGAAYVFAESDGSFIEEQKLVASDAAVGDQLGYSVSLGDDRILVGAPLHDGSRGAAYVFVRSGSSWAEEQKLVANDAVEFDLFGVSVALFGDRALVGAYFDEERLGAAYLFVRSESSWTEEQKLVASDGVAGDRFGNAVSLGDGRALIGAYAKNGGHGAAYVFLLGDGLWTEEAKLVASDGINNDLFGWSVSLARERALLGANYDDNLRGAAYVFRAGPASR
jgi:hypothetical protein